MKTETRPQTGIIMLLVLVLVVGIALGLLIARPLYHKEEDLPERAAPTEAPPPVEEPATSPVPAEEELPPADEQISSELPSDEENAVVEGGEEAVAPVDDALVPVAPHALGLDAIAQAAEEPLHLAAGEVYLYDGFGWTWLKPLEGVPVNEMSKDEFQLIDEEPVYLGTAYETRLGVDVSEHQYEIDWSKVARSGVDFAYIRIGRRGYTEGGLFSDPWFENNYNGAVNAGLQVGVYFYSQAVSEEEAREEAQFVLDALQGRSLDLPIVFDWEKIDNEDADIARTNGLGMERRTDCAVAFCEAIREGGYDASVYFNRNLGYYGYDLRRLTDYDFWFALPIAPPELYWPSFYYKVNIWQYSFTDTVPGIEGETDMNMMFIPVSQG